MIWKFVSDVNLYTIRFELLNYQQIPQSPPLITDAT